jgi:hypothetical protein
MHPPSFRTAFLALLRKISGNTLNIKEKKSERIFSRAVIGIIRGQESQENLVDSAGGGVIVGIDRAGFPRVLLL